MHFLAFDLFVGRWIYQDAQHREITALVVSPILSLTLLPGAVGFDCYTIVRARTNSE